MSIINDIRACLDTHLTSTVGIPQIAPENVRFNPTTGVSHIRATLVPNIRQPAVRGLNPQQYYAGFYNLLICTPEGLGSGAGYEIADLLLERFDATKDILYTNPTDTILQENGDTLLLESGDSLLLGSPTIVTIDRAEVGPSYTDSPFYCTPVIINWYTYK